MTEELTQLNKHGDRRGMDPHSRANLVKGQFKKGVVTNPRGRPPNEMCITNLVREQLGETCPHDPSKTWAQWLALQLLELASQNPAAYAQLLDRVEGKVVFPFRAEQPPEITFVIGRGYMSSQEAQRYIEQGELPEIEAPAGPRICRIDEEIATEGQDNGSKA